MNFRTLVLIIAGIFFLGYGFFLNLHSSILVEWSTASELDTAGFNIYRADEENGTYQKINLELIPASNDPLSGGSYSFEDKNVRPGNKYYYQLEDVETSGTSNRHETIQAVAARNGMLEMAIGLIFLVNAVVLGLRYKKAWPSPKAPTEKG